MCVFNFSLETRYNSVSLNIVSSLLVFYIVISDGNENYFYEQLKLVMEMLRNELLH